MIWVPDHLHPVKETIYQLRIIRDQLGRDINKGPRSVLWKILTNVILNVWHSYIHIFFIFKMIKKYWMMSYVYFVELLIRLHEIWVISFHPWWFLLVIFYFQRMLQYIWFFGYFNFNFIDFYFNLKDQFYFNR